MDRARRYVAWLERHARAVFATSGAVVAVSIYLIAFHLPLLADFAYLLPQDAPAIAALRRLDQRLPAKDATLVVLVAPDPATRAAAGALLVHELRGIGPEYLERLEVDDADTRAFFRAHRHLYVPLADLVAARDALTQRIAGAKLRANPLYLELDDPPPADHRLDELHARRRAAEAQLANSRYVSADGRTQVVVIHTSFRATDVDRDRALLARFDAAFTRVRARYPAVEVGAAGGVPSAVAEHDALAHGMLWSSLVTAVLVSLVLLVHLRGKKMLGLLGLQIVAGTIVSLGLAALTVGHLNAATAFLGAIIAGNGVNYGILLSARYAEERRDGDGTGPSEAMARAIAGTLRPTLVAALGAAIAYGALAVTSFRGFADFAVIGGVGMIACWATSYTLLPLLILKLAPTPRQYRREPLFGRVVVGALGTRRPALVLAITGAIVAAAGAVTWRFVAADPFEYDMSKIRSDGAAAQEARHWMLVSNAAFGRGVIGRTYIAADRADQVPAIVDAVHAARRTPAGASTIGSVASILDAVPPDQVEKLAVLRDLRALLDEAGDDLPEDERVELAELRPPDDLRAITIADLPRELTAQLAEVDGRIGLVVAVRPSAGFDDWDGHALLRFASVIRELHLPSGETVTTSGSPVIFADILAMIRHDGPRVTVTAAVALVAMVLLVVGRNRRAVAVLAGTATGSIVMVAICSLAGLKINFLDFVALPIALGLGIDYAINVAHRADKADPLTALRTTGGTVLVCSLTTMIGYASLLVSQNHAIRDFGFASLVGEITCVVTALTLVPALIASGRRMIDR